VNPKTIDRPLIMGILNVTPDSFSDGGQFIEPAAAVEHALRMVEEGADLVDVGGESTRPRSVRVPAAEQLRRVLSIIESIRRALPLQVEISIDTTSAEVARQALDAGASIINDVSAGRDDPGMFALAQGRGVPIVLMHMQGEPATMQVAPRYEDCVGEVTEWLAGAAESARRAGLPNERIVLDPGIGFGKTLEHNLALLHEIASFADLRVPVLVGASRKRFIGQLTGVDDPAERVEGTAGAVAWCAANGVDVVRVHDVLEMIRVVRVVDAIVRGAAP
jgi:dihydropteroate synthase